MSFWENIWRRISQALGALSGRERPLFEFDQELVASLQEFAEREERQTEDVAADLLTYALAQRQTAQKYLLRWRELSPREQQVVALTCLNYTNRQIAATLVISPETVKTYVRRVLRKFDVNSKAQLRQTLSEWDFSEWPDMLA